MEYKKTKTAEYHPFEKLNIAKNLNKFAILKLRNKPSTPQKAGFHLPKIVLCKPKVQFS